jgi:hypothetical protein
MARKSSIADNRLSFTLLRRKFKHDDGFVYYARWIDTTTEAILAQRSTGTDDERKAAAKAGQYLVELPIEKWAKAKIFKKQEGFEAAERLRNMDLASFLTWFWAPGDSDYIRDRIDADKPLSNYYILCQSRYIAKHAVFPINPSRKPV